MTMYGYVNPDREPEYVAPPPGNSDRAAAIDAQNRAHREAQQAIEESSRPRTLAELAAAPTPAATTRAGEQLDIARQALRHSETDLARAERVLKEKHDALDGARALVSAAAEAASRGRMHWLKNDSYDVPAALAKRGEAEAIAEAQQAIVDAHRATVQKFTDEVQRLETAARAAEPDARAALDAIVMTRRNAARAATKIADKIRADVAPLLAAYHEALARAGEQYSDAALLMIAPKSHDVDRAIEAALLGALVEV